MIRCGYYAPLKAPDHPVPSGDRTMARALVAALEYGGHCVDLASGFQTRDGKGDDATQRELIEKATREVDHAVALGRKRGWQVWITYHSYYKAPDLLGPYVAQALGIPYVQIEATRARKRLSGPWSRFARITEEAADAAALVFYLTERDSEALAAYAPAGQRHRHLRPFLPRADLPDATLGKAKLLSVGMFREGDKLASYDLISQTLALLETKDWQLSVAGDGPAQQIVRRLLSPFENQITYLGALDANEMIAAYQSAGILLWPGVNEAFGMVYLEAQAAGLVVVAQDRPGVRDVLAPGVTRPSVEQGPVALAQQIDLFINNEAARFAAAQQARNFVAQHHLIEAAARTLEAGLREVVA